MDTCAFYAVTDQNRYPPFWVNTAVMFYGENIAIWSVSFPDSIQDMIPGTELAGNQYIVLGPVIKTEWSRVGLIVVQEQVR